MLAPNYTAADFLKALQGLLPRGRIWPRAADAVQTQVLSGLAPSYARSTARANYLLTDAFPATTYELLPEWESTLGLPDPCAGVAPTIAQRQAQVLARFVGVGGPTIQSLTAFAANLGYTVTINQFVEARAGQLHAGDPCNGTAWSFAWQVNAPINTVTIATAGAMAAGDPLASWGNTVLECEMKAVMPAHTIPIFSYS
ncbi:YmfQ family protein [Paraburkholderia hospita]|uniref:YmfQ family protein n=1 Tax=Paraburkholderia hospita TaxID=169430 RepID=UPI000B345F74|nr:putative phage tail protein [Paraburkholderia hospita]OUL79971.1 phage tail protein [Paraburkholderia hospita]